MPSKFLKKRIIALLSSIAILCGHFSISLANPTDIIRELGLKQKPIDTIESSFEDLDSDDLSGFLEVYSSLLDIDRFRELLKDNFSLEGVSESLAEYNGTNGTSYEISDTTTRLLFYDIRLREIPEYIEELLEAGGRVELFVDSSTSQEFEALSKKEIKKQKWTEEQLEAYLRQYDLDKDGVVGAEDVEKINHSRYLGIKIFERLNKLKEKYPQKFLLKPLPDMLVPGEGQLYQPIMHAKSSVSYITKKTIPFKAAEYNSNMTPNEFFGRLVDTKENMDNYLAGKTFKRLPMAEPYPQVALQLGSELRKIIRDIIKADNKMLRKLFEEGSFSFEQLSLPRTRRFVDANGGYIDIRVHTTFGNREATGPWDPMVKFLENNNNTIESLQSAQFVFSNKKLMQALTSALKNKANFQNDTFSDDEKFMMVVNSDHGLQSWSQLWKVFSAVPNQIYRDTRSLEPGLLTKAAGPEIKPKRKFNLFSPLLNGGFRTYWSKMHYNLPEGEEYPNLEGNMTPSKNHSKVMAVRYKNETNGEIRYRVFITSANPSQNAGVGTYEHAIEIDTANPQLFDVIKKHVQALGKHVRTNDFSGTYFRILLYSLFEKPEKILQNIESFDFKLPTEWDQTTIDSFSEVYSSYQIDEVIEKVNDLASLTSLSNTGEKFIERLKNLKNTKERFTDEEFYHLWRISIAKETRKSSRIESFVYSKLGIEEGDAKVNSLSCKAIFSKGGQ